MTDTPNLTLPYILAAQSQKHVTHNEALRILDSVVQLTVFSRNLAAPPVAPVEGDRYIVAASPTGAWVGQTNKIAAFQDAAWLFYPPKEGWITWIADENIALAFDGAAWTTLSGGVTAHSGLTGLTADDHLQYQTNARGDARYTAINPVTFGVNATADATNKFAVASAASLFNHVGTGGHQIKINKALAADTASFLFQTGFSGRAEIGLTGDDDFHFKVSANGTAFNEAILINKTTGACTFPNTALGGGEANTASNVGTAGSGIFKQKTGVNLELKKINAGSTKVAVTDDTVNSKVDVDVVEANLTLANIGGTIDLGGVKASGTVAAARLPAHTGDVTSAAGSVALTVAANAVTNAKAAQMAANTIKGNNTGAVANSSDLTAAQTKALLAITSADVSGLGALATAASVNLSTQATGTLQAAQHPAHTGDVTSAAGSLALTVAANAVTNAKAAQMAANTIKGNNTGAVANSSDLTVAQVAAMLPAFVASGAAHTAGLVPDPGATVGATRYLREDATWFTPPGGGGGGVPGGTTGQVQFNSAGVFGGLTVGGDATLDTSTGVLTLAANAVTNAKAAQMAANTIKGNNTGATANAGDLTGAQVQALLVAKPTVQTFTASGTWTKPTGVKRVRVRAVGGGGGGAGATAAAAAACCGGGAGAGAYVEGILDVTATATVVVTIGAAGAAGVAANGAGGSGGNTSFGTLLSGGGGAGGGTMASGTAVLTSQGGLGGVVLVAGAINAGGGAGLGGIRLSGTIPLPGAGASSVFGGSARGSNAAGAGAAGVAPGAGGSGASSTSATGFAGGAGAAGIVIVEEFY